MCKHLLRRKKPDDPGSNPGSPINKMAEKIKLKSIRRFGARYGRKTKQRFGTIEQQQRKKHKCPYCNAEKVKRISVGIWLCSKCGSKFTGKAYSLRKSISFEKESESNETVSEEKTEEIQKEGEEEAV